MEEQKTVYQLLSIAAACSDGGMVMVTFVRRLFELSARVQKIEHHLKLNAGARSDLAWWLQLVRGITMLGSLKQLVPTTVLTSD